MLKDILLGIFWSFTVSALFEIEFTFGWMLLGVFFALLPDLDFFIEYAQRGRVGGKVLGAHRVVTHIPLLFVVLGIGIFFVFGSAVALLYALGVIGHFIHDSRGMGYGYRALFPFSRRFYKLFADPEGHTSYRPEHFIQSWTAAEVRGLQARHGNDNWLRDDLRYHVSHWKNIGLKIIFFGIVLALLVLLNDRYF